MSQLMRTLHFSNALNSAPQWLAYRPRVHDVKRHQPPLKPSAPCSQCGTSETPEWRQGPLGPRTLCNKYAPSGPYRTAHPDQRRCGLRYRKEVLRVETMRQRMSITSLVMD